MHLDGAPADPEVLAAMSRSLIHRGPDDQGLMFFDAATGRTAVNPDGDPAFNLGLASRRLSIQDLSAHGRMPLANEDGSVWVVFNGEIYNFMELRGELSGAGHCFRTRTDTEVIVHAYEEWGPDCQERFNGMWALALFDARRGRLFCSRDRLGIKPFYYFFDGRVFIFGSEIKALLAHPLASRRPDRKAVFNYLARSYRFVDGRPTTFFQDVRQLEAGRSLIVSAEGPQETTYWSIDPDRRTEGLSDDRYAARYLELLDDSVRLRLRSDVPVACQLSGGLDSSAVAALASRVGGPGLPVFSACYDRLPFDERAFIIPTAERLAAVRHFVFPRPDDLMATLPEMIRHFDEPVCTVTFFAHWKVMEEVRRQGFKVLLNGHGADELAAGYYDHFLHHFGDLRQSGANGYLTREVEAWLDNHGRHRRGQLRDYFDLLDRGVGYMEDYLRLFQPYEAALEPEFAAEHASPKPDESPFSGLLSNRLYNELRFETLPAVLKAEDRTTMAHGIESRLPFLDYRLVEYMFSVPNVMKIRRGLGKYIQRRALNGLLPDEVVWRKEKVGFNAPSEFWFRNELRSEVEELIGSSSLVERGILNREGFGRVWEAHQAGRANHYQFLWQVINMETWLRMYFG